MRGLQPMGRCTVVRWYSCTVARLRSCALGCIGGGDGFEILVVSCFIVFFGIINLIEEVP